MHKAREFQTIQPFDVVLYDDKTNNNRLFVVLDTIPPKHQIVFDPATDFIHASEILHENSGNFRLGHPSSIKPLQIIAKVLPLEAEHVVEGFVQLYGENSREDAMAYVRQLALHQTVQLEF